MTSLGWSQRCATSFGRYCNCKIFTNVHYHNYGPCQRRHHHRNHSHQHQHQHQHQRHLTSPHLTSPRFGKNPAFEDTRKSWAVEDEEEWEQWEWMTQDDPNPTGIKTEREVSVENRDLPLWRALLVRK